MNARLSFLCLLAATAGAPLATRAQAPAPAPAPWPNVRSEPEIKRTVVEDDKVRIEELRVRGQVQRIMVSPKASGVRPYEIVPPEAGRDASQNKGLSGQRLWQLFSF